MQIRWRTEPERHAGLIETFTEAPDAYPSSASKSRRSRSLRGSKPALGGIVRDVRIDLLTTVQKVDRDTQNTPTRRVLATVPAQQDTKGLDFIVYAGDGTTVVGPLTGSLDPATRVVTLASGNVAEALAATATPGSSCASTAGHRPPCSRAVPRHVPVRRGGG
jgi:hypothetical protein